MNFMNFFGFENNSFEFNDVGIMLLYGKFGMIYLVVGILIVIVNVIGIVLFYLLKMIFKNF